MHAIIDIKEAEVEEKENMLSGKWYKADDELLVSERTVVRTLLQRYNLTIASDFVSRDVQIRNILGEVGENVRIEQPFRCNYGKNISVGNNFSSDFNLTILDSAKVTIKDNVKIGPNCNIYTTSLPKDSAKRAEGYEQALPVTIEDNVWIGGNATILAGVSFGKGAIIGAGAVVTRNVPANTIYAGVPAKMISVNYDKEWQDVINIVDKVLKGEMTLAVSSIQKNLTIGYGKASYLMTLLEDCGAVRVNGKGKRELAVDSVYDISLPKNASVKYPEDLEYFTANWQMIVDTIYDALNAQRTHIAISYIQRNRHLGYNRASVLMETMKDAGIVEMDGNDIKIAVKDVSEINIPKHIKVKMPK